MQDTDFSDDFFEFIQRAVPDVDAAQCLVEIYKQPDTAWSPDQLASSLNPALRLTHARAATYLELFKARGVLEIRPDRHYQYRPAAMTIDKNVRTLAQAYQERPVTLIRIIYALRDTKIQSFADAFRLRKT
jgi:hypothetical protein